MKMLSKTALAVLCVTVSTVIAWSVVAAQAAEQKAAARDVAGQKAPGSPAQSLDTIRQTIQQRFSRSRPDLLIEHIEPSQIAGLYTVKVKNGPTLYVTSAGDYFVMGDLFQTAEGKIVNVSEQAREQSRAQALNGVNVDDMIVFAPKEQPTKAIVNVFTDVDCYYCQKLHQEVPDLNRVGIEVRYLAYPRAGIGSESYKKIASAWCAGDQRTAITRLKNRQDIKRNVCEDNPVKQHFALGQQIGVNGTPALISAKGKLMPGYMPTLRLAQELGVEVEPELAAELLKKQAAQSER